MHSEELPLKRSCRGRSRRLLVLECVHTSCKAESMFSKPEPFINNLLLLQMEEINLRGRNTIHRKKYPVMVYVHGGGWFSGSGASFLHGPEYIMDEEVVLVTINYRLGIFGKKINT